MSWPEKRADRFDEGLCRDDALAWIPLRAAQTAPRLVPGTAVVPVDPELVSKLGPHALLELEGDVAGEHLAQS